MDQRLSGQRNHRNKTLIKIKLPLIKIKLPWIFYFIEVSPFNSSLLQAGERKALPAEEFSSNPWFHQVTTALENAGSRHKCYFKTNSVTTTQQNQ